MTLRTEFPSVIVAALLVTATLFMPLVSGYLGWAWRVEFTLDRSEYPAGSEGTIDEWVINAGPTVLDIYEAIVRFDWQKESGQHWYVGVDVEVQPKQRVHLAKFAFTIPENVTPGRHTFEIGLKHRHLGLREGWQDDGLQWFESPYEILIAQPERRPEPNIEIVNMTAAFKEEEKFYVGDVRSGSMTLKNTGDAAAKQLKIAIEDIKENIVSVETSPPMDIEPGATAQWTLKVRGEKPGNTTGKLRFYLAGTVVSEQEIPIRIKEPALELVNITQTPRKGESIYPDDVLTARFVLKNREPSTMKEISISMEVPPGLTLVESSPPISIDPDATGQLSYKVSAEKTGNYTIRVLFLKSGVQLPSYKVTANIVVSEKTAFNMQTIGIIVAVLVSLVAVAAVVSRRRRKAAAPPPQPPPPPPQATPYAAAAGFCPNCGAPEIPGDTFCHSCGARTR